MKIQRARGRAMGLMSVLGLLLGIVSLGCGRGGGHDDAPDPTLPEATATAAPSPTQEPTPSVTPTPEPEPPFAEVVLGIVTVSGAPRPNGGNAFKQYVLRNEGGQWESVLLSLVPPDASVYGVTFASPTVAWAFGGRGADVSHGLLLRSDDAGRTWRNVSSALPAACPRIFDAAFSDENTGYVVGRQYFTSAVAFVTTDGGRRWSSVAVPTTLPGGSYALGLRDEAVELAASAGSLVVSRLDDPALPSVTLDASGGLQIGPNAVGTAGSVGVIAEAARAVIVRSAAPGEPWLPQPIDVTGPFQLRAIDMRDALHGVAGGQRGVLGPVSALLLVTDDGVSWRAGTITDVPDGWSVMDVLRLRDTGAVAVVMDVTSGKTENLIVRSEDDGLSWHPDPTGFEHAQIWDLARNTERR